MELGSHNTFTYLPPKKWWMWLGMPIYKCQHKSLEKQLDLGISILDIRVRFDKDGNVLLCHGLYEAKFPKMNERDFASFIISKIGPNRKMKIRLILETNKSSLFQETMFIKLGLEFIHQSSDNITFLGGYRKFDWGKVYKFGEDDDIFLVQLVSSMAYDVRWYEKIFPYLYACRKNKKNINRWKYSSANVLIDFV